MSDNPQFRDETGQVTGVRVLPPNAEGAHYEVSLSTQGILESSKYNALWTYTQVQRNDGSIYGQGDGVLTTECGEVIYLKGSGSAPGKEADGGVIFKTINHHHTASEKFKHLNGVAGVGIYNVSPEGKTTAQFSIL
ncbi:hypothetical protein F7C95_15555 [Opitutia bacterium ISCC 51]|jgi:hypothetical protein|nr:hypothetical protein [bacterium]QXD23329.1 hypothetical protein F7C95_15555 [Opitutae bacterium ISCC 51]QXD27401.1 hypothetical protein GA003_15455 [Opitutae bacterium ISCC 52]